MLYDDVDACPATAGEYERRCDGAAYVSVGEARGILRSHGVPGRSKLDGDQALEAARRQFPEEFEAVRLSHVTRYRWPVAHALGLGYDELEQVEAEAGVTPIAIEGATRGGYATADDVARVYETAAAVRARRSAVPIRLRWSDADEREAAQAVLDAVRTRYEVLEPKVCDDGRGRGRLYATVLVPAE